MEKLAIVFSPERRAMVVPSTPEVEPNQCPVCGNKVNVVPSQPDGDIPCSECGNILWFVQRPVGEAVILTFLPGLKSASESLERVNEVVTALGDSPQPVLNVRHLPVMTSTFINMLVALCKRARPEGATLRLCGLHPDTLEIFKVMKIESFFEIYDDEQDALAGV